MQHHGSMIYKKINFAGKLVILANYIVAMAKCTALIILSLSWADVIVRHIAMKKFAANLS